MAERLPSRREVLADLANEAQEWGMYDGWDGVFTPEQEAFDQQVQANDAALLRALSDVHE